VSDRETILQALKSQHLEATPYPSWRGHDALYADAPEHLGRDLVTSFKTRLEMLRGVVHIAATESEAGEILMTEIGGRAALSHSGALLEAVAAKHDRWSDSYLTAQQDLATVEGDLTRGSSPRCAAFAVGITEADALIARTGSVLLTTTTCGGRRLSVLPEHHIVVARSSQIVPSLEEGLSRIKSQGKEWSSACIITGPSRTADIEKILVFGAHGPKKITVILIVAGN
jgi:L-lactate utilization protein LutC